MRKSTASMTVTVSAQSRTEQVVVMGKVVVIPRMLGMGTVTWGWGGRGQNYGDEVKMGTK